MIFIDSWVWIEYFAEDDRWRDAEEVLERIPKEGAVITPTVLMEVHYRIERTSDERRADRVIDAIRRFDDLEVLPITTEVALNAAKLREKHYQRGERELSYADAIHLAAALMTGCDLLCSGDSDFEGLEDVGTVIV